MQSNQQSGVMYDIKSFCEAHRISRALFYKLIKEGKGPTVVKVNRRTLITAEAAAEWRNSLERVDASQPC